MKDEEKHQFTSFDFLTTALSLAIICSVAIPILTRNLQSGSIEVAQQQIDTLTEQVLHPDKTRNGFALISRVEASTLATIHTTPSSRTPASVTGATSDSGYENFGQDPWGHPYHVAFVRNPSGMPTHLIVWSDGPNRKNETRMSDLTFVRSPAAVGYFQGDDVGRVTPLR